MIYLGTNMFNGSLSRICSNVTEFGLSNKSFSVGIFPFLCHQLDTPNSLEILHLGENILSDSIADCWMNWPSLGVIKLVNNNLTGEIPTSMGSLQSLESIHMSNNSVSGGIPPSFQYCTKLVTLDLGLNKFIGSIPTWIGSSLSNLKVLGLRSNKLKGHIPYELCNLLHFKSWMLLTTVYLGLYQNVSTI